MRKIFSILILTLFLISCMEQSTPPLDSASYEQWRSYNIHNYTVDQVRSCFCINGGEKMRITVRSDSVFQVMRLSDSSTLPYSFAKQYYSIDALFGVIQNSKTDSLIIEYDSQFGYPSKLDINPQMHPVDGGVMYQTSNLQIR